MSTLFLAKEKNVYCKKNYTIKELYSFVAECVALGSTDKFTLILVTLLSDGG